MSWRRAKLNSIDGLDAVDLTHLKAAGFEEAGQLVDALHAAADPALATLAALTGISKAKTAKVLAKVLEVSATRSSSDWLAEHWADLAVVASVLALGVAIWVKPSPPASTPEARSALSMPLADCAPLLKQKLPTPVDILFSARQGPPAGKAMHVVLSAVGPLEGTACAISITLPAKDLEEAAKWVGSSNASVALAAGPR